MTQILFQWRTYIIIKEFAYITKILAHAYSTVYAVLLNLRA